MSKKIVRVLGIAALAAVVPLSAAHAGPPFVTDDPQPTDYQQLETYLYSSATRADHATSGTALGLEVNWGALPNVQISIAVPLDYQPGTDHETHFGLGAASFGVKYRFIEEDENGWRPQVAFYPSIEAVIGGPLKDGPAREFFPLWAQKSFGPWTTFGGGGYWNNPGEENRNSWFCGWALLRQVSPALQLGAEVFHQTADKIGGRDSSGLGIGALYDLSEHFHLVGSVNTGLEHGQTTNQFSYYLALEWTT